MAANLKLALVHTANGRGRVEPEQSFFFPHIILLLGIIQSALYGYSKAVHVYIRWKEMKQKTI